MKVKVIICILLLSLTGCATHTKQILVGGLVGGAVGAGLGYTVVHHGTDKKYEVPNTIITSVLFSLAFMGALAYHYNSLDEQKIEITSKFTKPALLQYSGGPRDPDGIEASLLQNEVSVSAESIGKYSIKLDDQTRWVYPTFRKRLLKPETSGTEYLSARYTWDVVKQGFFVSREQQPMYFTDESLPHETEAPAKPSKTKKQNEEEPSSEPKID